MKSILTSIALFLLFSVASLYTQAQNPYIIPVVFHILHQNGPENISDLQVLDAMRILNEDYSKQNADIVDVVPEFISIAADMQIQFRLAQLDPYGDSTTGIDRINTPLTNIGNDSAKINQWNPARYLNIWVVKKLNGGAAAYAYFPYEVAGTPEKDGLIILHNYVGSIGTSGSFTKRALTHELGHWLCIRHIWSGTNNPNVPCTDGDSVSDTPLSRRWTGCYGGGDKTQMCDTNVIENYQNFMEYSACASMYTNGQKERSHSCLNSTNRSNIWSVQNLVQTGLLPASTNIWDDGFDNLAVYPNPFTSVVQLKGLPDEIFDFTIMDITGRTVTEKKRVLAIEGSLSIQVNPSLAPGIYMLRIGDGKACRDVKLVRQ